MRVFVIHNVEDKTREQSFLMEFEEQGITKFEVFPAIMDPKMPRRGISRSHKACVQKAKDQELPWVNIIEDDVWFMQKGAYKRFLDIFVQEVPGNCDLYFGGNYSGDFSPITARLATSKGNVAGFMNYIVCAQFYDKFLAADENYNIDYFLTATDHTNAKCYTAYPMLSLQHDGFSYNTMMNTEYNPQIHRRYSLWDGKQ